MRGKSEMNARFLASVFVTVSLTMSAMRAAEPQVLTPPQRYGAAQKVIPPAISSHPAALTVSINKDAPASVAPEFYAHVQLWRSFDVAAGVCGTQPAAINDLGEIIGTYFDSQCNSHGFLRKAGGEIVTFDDPNAGYPSSIPYPGTTPTDINNAGDIVGSYTDAAGGIHGFVRSRQGTFTTIDDPSSTSSPPATVAQAINDWGVVVGYWYDSNGNSHGFVRQMDGAFIPFEPAGALYSQGYHINDFGETGGDWTHAATGTS